MTSWLLAAFLVFILFGVALGVLGFIFNSTGKAMHKALDRERDKR